jgi:hypothetical protein
MVPSWSNPTFVGREEILVQLESLLRHDSDNQKQPRAAIYGLGGIGYVQCSRTDVLVVNAAVTNSG